VLTGSKQEIAENLARLSGEVREAIVFVDESAPAASEAVDIFAEMHAFMVDACAVDDSREAIYLPEDGTSKKAEGPNGLRLSLTTAIDPNSYTNSRIGSMS